MRLLVMSVYLFALMLPVFHPLYDAASSAGNNQRTQQTFREENYQPLPIYEPIKPTTGPFVLYLPSVSNYRPIPSKLTAIHRSGQTFILWNERLDLQGEKYRVYRFNQPINQFNLSQATLLGEVGKDSARFYANRFIEVGSHQWQDRFVARYVIQNMGDPIAGGTGFLVWTLAPQNFDGASEGYGFYAVSVTPIGGSESLDPANTMGPIAEAVADPMPVEIKSTTNTHISDGGHIFIQYMDLGRWNPTFHAPNKTNGYYGVKPTDPGVVDNLQYAYDYVVYLPTPAMCGGQVPDILPVILDLHGHRSNTYHADVGNPDGYCSYVILPQDETDTWWFGFAQQHDYRKGGEVAAWDTIANYTERRVLRMLSDLMRNPLGPPVDPQRVYVQGQSMGGSGALAFAQRYPNIFAAAYASQPMTNYRTAGVTNIDWVADVSIKWGKPVLNLPVQIDAPNGWAALIQKYNGTGVWDWQDYQDNASAVKLTDRLYDEMAPIGITHGTADAVVTWNSQGKPVYQAFDLGRRAWGGLVNNSTHLWQYYYGLPPSLAPVPKKAAPYSWVPYRNLQVVKDETVPGLSNFSDNSPKAPGGYYNMDIVWSSSWNTWDGTPIDQPDLWQISLCFIWGGEITCGVGDNKPQTVDVTPRRLQHFVVTPGGQYDWENYSLKDKKMVDSGSITADSRGLLLVKGFKVTKYGNRLIIKPHHG